MLRFHKQSHVVGMTVYDFQRGDGGPRAAKLGVRRKRPRPLGPYSRRPKLGHLDRRTHEGRLFASFQDAMIRHLGGNPSAPQLAIIERATWLRLRLATLDGKVASGSFSELDSRTYLAWSNSLTRTLAQLGLTPTAGAQPTLSEVLADIASRRGAASADDEEAA